MRRKRKIPNDTLTPVLDALDNFFSGNTSYVQTLLSLAALGEPEGGYIDHLIESCGWLA